MSKSLNKVQLIGHLGGDPQMRYTSAGVPVTTFSLATNRQWQGKDGTLREETDWHTVVAWDRLAQICSEHLSKGRLVYIEGRLQTRSWDQDGQTRYKTEIVASDMLILDSRGTTPVETAPEPEPTESPRPTRTARSSAPAAAAPATRSSRSAVIEAEEDPDELPF
jgi:single-strand DNA-binding protein